MEKSDKINSNLLVFGAVLFLIFGVVLRFSYLDRITRTPDERVFNNYASKLHEHGVVKAIPEIIGNYLQRPKDWFYPPPTRFGQYFLGYTAQKALGDKTISSAAMVSVTSSIAALIASALLAKYLYGNYGFFLMSILAATSSLSLSSSRRYWNESIMELSMVLLLGAAFIIARQKTFRPLVAASFFAVGAFSFAIKESALLSLGLVTLIPLIVFVNERNWRQAGKTILLAFLTLAAGLSLPLLAAGSYDKLSMIYRNHAMMVSYNRYAVLYQDGPISDFLRLFHILSPGFSYFILFGLLCYPGYLLLRREKTAGAEDRFLHFSFLVQGGILILFLVAVGIPQYFKNLRYLSPIYDLLPLFGIAPVILVLPFLGRIPAGKIALQTCGVLLALYCGYLNLGVWQEIIIDKQTCFDWNLRLLTECGALSKDAG